MSEQRKRGRKPDPNGPKKYFGDREEEAIVQYLRTNDIELKNKLFRDIIDPALRHLVAGVMRMPKFQKIIGISREQLEEDAYYHVIFQLDKFEPGRVNEAGQAVKAYSYYGTCAKNYILGEKIRLDKLVNEQGGLPVDVTEINDFGTEDSNSEKDFEDLREDVVREIDRVIEQRKMNNNDLTVGNSLKYILANWHKIEFQTKNEFLRLLCQYCQLDPPVVGRSLKKFKTAIYDKLLAKKPSSSSTNTKQVKVKIKVSDNKITPKEQILNDSALSKSDKMRALYSIGIVKTTEIAILTFAHPAFVATVIRKHKMEKH